MDCMEECDHCLYGNWKKISSGNQWEPPEWDFKCDLDCWEGYRYSHHCGNFVWDYDK